MKFLFPICFIAAFTLLSCKQNSEDNLDKMIQEKNIPALKKYKSRLMAEQDEISKQIKEINMVLDSVDPNQSTFVSVYTPKDSLFYSFIETQGSVVAANNAQVTPEMGGILTLRVREGQSVGAGQLLGMVDDNGLDDQLRQAQVQVEQAKIQVRQAQVQSNLSKVTYQKQASLWNQKIGSEIQYLQAKAQYEASVQTVNGAQENVNIAQRQVSAVRKQMGNLQIRAPFSGVVEKIMIKSGQVVGPGSPILQLVGVSSVKIEANLPEKFLTSVKVGTPVTVYLPSINRTINSKVTLISSSINPASRTFKIEVPVLSKDGLVKPNMVAQLKINDYVNDQAVVIPANLIGKDPDGKSFVYVVDASKKNKKSDGVAVKKIITVGRVYDGNAEVLAGLGSGEEIIAEGFDKVTDNSSIEIITD